MIDQELVELELKISKMLRFGVIAAGILLFIGWMSTLQVSENPFKEFAEYQPQSLTLQLHKVLAEHHWGLLIAYFGLVVLISLPFLRVLMTAVLFSKQREKVLALISCVVMLALIISMCLGLDI